VAGYIVKYFARPSQYKPGPQPVRNFVDAPNAVNATPNRSSAKVPKIGQDLTTLQTV